MCPILLGPGCIFAPCTWSLLCQGIMNSLQLGMLDGNPLETSYCDSGTVLGSVITISDKSIACLGDDNFTPQIQSPGLISIAH